MSFRKWTLVPRGVAEGAADDGDEDYAAPSDTAGKAKYTREMLPCRSSRKDFVLFFLEGLPARPTQTPSSVDTPFVPPLHPPLVRWFLAAHAALSSRAWAA